MSGSERAADLLAKARAARSAPSPEQRASMARALFGSAAAATGVGLTATAAGATTASVLTVTKVVAAVVAVGATAAGGVWWARAPERVHAAAPQAMPAPSVVVAGPPPVVPEPVVVEMPPPPARAPALPKARQPFVAPAPIEEAEPDRQVVLLARASQFLERGDGVEAARLAAEVRRVWPDGVLALDAGVIEVLAHCALGAHARALGVWSALPPSKHAHPGARRVARECGFTPSTDSVGHGH